MIYVISYVLVNYLCTNESVGGCVQSVTCAAINISSINDLAEARRPAQDTFQDDEKFMVWGMLTKTQNVVIIFLKM